MIWSDVQDKLIFSGGGMLLSLAISYVTVIKDMSYIKGQLGNILESVRHIYGLRESHILIMKDIEKNRKDVDAAHEKIRELSNMSHITNN